MTRHPDDRDGPKLNARSTGHDVHGPHDVPDLRCFLMERWRSGGVFELLARVNRNRMLPHHRNIQWTEREESAWQRGHLADAKLWWVGEAMVDEISHVAGVIRQDMADMKATDVPGLVVVDRPGFSACQPGLVVLEKPIPGTDAFNQSPPIWVDALVYGTTLLPQMRGLDPRTNTAYAIDRRYGVGIASLRRIPAGDYDWSPENRAAWVDERKLDPDSYMVENLVSAEMFLQGKTPPEAKGLEYGREWGLTGADLPHDAWMPLGRSDWPVHDPISQPIEPALDDVSHVSMMEDRAWLAALFLVAQEKLVADVTAVEPSDRRKRNASRRAKLSAQVHVVYLRQPVRKDGRGKPEAGTRKTPRGHVVKSHPRWQPYGPGLTLRKPIIVPRHSRGNPDDLMPPGGGTVTAVVR